MEERRSNLAQRMAMAERQIVLTLDSLEKAHAKIGALEVLMVEIVKTAGVGRPDLDRIIAAMGRGPAPAPALNLRRELARLLGLET